MVVCLVGSCLPGHWCTSGGAGVSRHGPPLVMPVAVVEAVAFEAPLAVAAASAVASAVVVRSRAGGPLGAAAEGGEWACGVESRVER